jgi:hypothetical protein
MPVHIQIDEYVVFTRIPSKSNDSHGLRATENEDEFRSAQFFIG